MSPADQNELAIRYRPLVEKLAITMARKFGKQTYHDLLSAANFGLGRAILKYDAMRGVPFGRYATMTIKREIVDEVRRNFGRNDRSRRRTNRVIPATDVFVSEDCLPLELMAVAVDEFGDVADDFESSMEEFRLTETHRFILREYFLYGRKLKEIGPKVNLSESRVCTLLKSILREIKENTRDR